MKRVEDSASIPAPPDEVFAYLADLDNVSEWQGGVTSARRTSDGPIGVGTTALVTRELMGQRIEAPLTLNEYEPPRRLGIGSEVSGIRVQAALDLAPSGDGQATDLAFAMEIRGSGFSSFMESMVASAAREEIRASLDRIAARFAGAGAG